MKSATRRKAKTVLGDLARRAVVAEEAAVARLNSRRRSLLEAATRKRMMKMMTRMKMNLVNRNSRKQQKPCALTEAHLCTPLIAN
jgi:hypothetical protein